VTTPSSPAPSPSRRKAPTAPPERRARVESAVKDWIDQLIDLGGGNRLLHYRDLAVGTLDLTATDDGDSGDTDDTDRTDDEAGGGRRGPVNTAALDQLRGGRRTRLRTLVPDPEHLGPAARRMRAIAAKALENHEEKGIRTLYLALGMATWSGGSTTTGTPPAAPVLLLPLTARPRDAAGEDFDLDVDGDPELNPVLAHYLATQKGIVLDAERLLADAQPDGLGTPDTDLLFGALRAEAADVAGFAIAERTVIANFTFAKLPMVRDLEQGIDQLAAHDLIAAIAGDPGAQAVLRGLRPDVDESLPDHLEPAEEFLVLPADASQHHVVNRVLAGESVVIQGPPGTGKSQTIANLIASLVARGRSVLFVAEKRAAIDAVVQRIDAVGLGDVVLDLHRDTVSRARVAAQLAAALHAARESTEPDHTVLHQKLVRQRDALVAHDTAMHEPRDPWGLSLYELQARILDFAPEARSALRFPRAVLDHVDALTLDRLADELAEYIRLGGPTLPAGGSPWATATVTTPEGAERARQWAEHLVPVAADVQSRLDALTLETGLRAAPTLASWRERLDLLRAVQATLERFDERVFAATTNLDGLVDDLAPAATAGILTSLVDRSYRAARRRARELRRPAGDPSPAQLHDELAAAADQQHRWMQDSLDGGAPRVPPSLAAATNALAQLDESLEALSRFLWIDADGRAPAAIVSWSVALASDSTTLFKLPRLRSIEAAFSAVGASSMIDFARSERLAADQAALCLRYAWHLSIYDAVGPAVLGGFDGAVHRERQRQFRDLDHRHEATTVERVRRAVAERVTDVRNRFADQSQLIENQASRKRGHLPLRRLFQQAPDVLTALQPCWTMSPLLVSQLLPADRPYFDVVVFDEASQVTPADAVPALLRGRQVVVAGDSRQLPPTAFFATDTTADRLAAEPDDGLADDDLEPLVLTDGAGAADADAAFAPPPSGDAEDTGAGADTGGPGADRPAAPALDLGLTRGYESVLDVVAALLRPGHLTWHYRSRDERLIAFSNESVYGGLLTTFPGTGVGGGVHLELVEPAPAGATTNPEVARVVDLVIDHARTRPGESLGVITMGLAHAERLTEALRLRLATELDADTKAFFDESAPERFFVKNLERVQGDERDAVILSVGYAKSPDGRLRYRFGPLLQAGGERRLNVAVTRARDRLTVVSTFSHLDMDPERSRAPGVQLLRSYLDYAARGGRPAPAPAPGPDGDPDGLDAFQRYVRDWLVATGAPVRARYGVSGYRLDFALGHPEDPARPVLAIECDGPTYHSSRTARDRDRLRQEVLERLGWRFHRIWSTAFYRDPEGETAAVAAAWHAALSTADADPAPPGGTDRVGPAAPAEAAATVTVTETGPDAETESGAGDPTPGDGEPGAAVGEDGRAGAKPVAGDGRPIAGYLDSELVGLVRWIESDTRLRTDDELLEDAVRELGYSRQGPRIVERLRRAIATVRAADPDPAEDPGTDAAP
jgi:very-short-patch-repair endonuclease